MFALVLLGALTSPAPAAPDDGITGAYARVEVGASHFGLSGTSLGPVSDSHGHAAKLFGGYRFATGIGIDAGHAALGSFSEALAVDGASGPQVLRGSIVFAAATGRWPIGEAFALHGRLGLSSGRVFGSDRLPSADRRTGRKTLPLIGVGAEHRPRPNIALTLNYDDYGKLSNQVKASAVLVGLHFTL